MKPRKARSLADVPAGKTVEIVHILFDSLRQKYREVGVRAGTRARFEKRTEDGIRLLLPDGSPARIAKDQARFIEVRVLPDELSLGHMPIVGSTVRPSPPINH